VNPYIFGGWGARFFKNLGENLIPPKGGGGGQKNWLSQKGGTTPLREEPLKHLFLQATDIFFKKTPGDIHKR